MKKARIILTSIALLAVVGGAFAFKAMRNLRPAYTYTGGTTWSSTTVGTLTYSTIVPVCVPLSIVGSTAYVSSIGEAAENVYTTTFSATVFTTKTAAAGPILSTTFTKTLCNAAAPLANTLITTLQ